MRTIIIPGKKPTKVSENNFIIALLDYLRTNYPKEECVVLEVTRKGKTVTEKPAAVLTLLRNPEMVIHYNKIVNREE